jgi:DNA-directed RNA polymerase specialized sigma24 family protein
MQTSTEHMVGELLVIDAQSGHREAFDTLDSRWQKHFWRHAYTMAGRSEAAWDITQVRWLSIIRGLARLRDPARFGARAYRIVNNKIIEPGRPTITASVKGKSI